ncbi:MAG TPA: aminoacyl-tRNA deacylase [Candidatus Rubneribacter avistercoris]|nr:aminoacyl-tRNA deacylase [Candidatus Rubneribacter avistercoris]
MARSREVKTNAVRELEAARADFEVRYFDCPEALSGVEVAQLLGLDEDRVFKTLVTVGRSGAHYVFMIPVACELDLRKAAAAAGEKAVAMVRARELLPLTGYVHGGCSPIGMKRLFPTAIDETAELFERIAFSGGRIGCQVDMPLSELARIVPLQVADLTAV